MSTFYPQVKAFINDRYFTISDVHIAILTNGDDYWFFTDSQKENVMDFNFIKEIKSQTKFLDNIDQFIGMLDIMKLMKKDDRD